MAEQTRTPIKKYKKEPKAYVYQYYCVPFPFSNSKHNNNDNNKIPFHKISFVGEKKKFGMMKNNSLKQGRESL